MVELQQMSVGESYEIKLKGHLDEDWADRFDGLTFAHEGAGTTILFGEIIDQAALHGFLKQIRDLGMPLLSVNRFEPNQTGIADAQQQEPK